MHLVKSFFSTKAFVFNILCLTLCTSSSCSLYPSPAESAVGGTVAGALTGAAIGAAIPSGKIAASAGLGAVIGLPAGLALGTYYIQNLEARNEEKLEKRIFSQEGQLKYNKKKIELFRDKLELSKPADPPLIDEKIEPFEGRTLGNW
jgi:hypothetical protein